MTPAVMQNHPAAELLQKQHLRMPSVSVELPAVGVDTSTAFPAFFVIDLRTVFSRDRAYRMYSVGIIASEAVQNFAVGAAKRSL